MKFKLTSDDDGHWFVIPSDKEKEYLAFLLQIEAANQDCELEYPDNPSWMVAIDSPENISFDAWEET